MNLLREQWISGNHLPFTAFRGNDGTPEMFVILTAERLRDDFPEWVLINDELAGFDLLFDWGQITEVAGYRFFDFDVRTPVGVPVDVGVRLAVENL